MTEFEYEQKIEALETKFWLKENRYKETIEDLKSDLKYERELSKIERENSKHYTNGLCMFFLFVSVVQWFF